MRHLRAGPPRGLFQNKTWGLFSTGTPGHSSQVSLTVEEKDNLPFPLVRDHKRGQSHDAPLDVPLPQDGAISWSLGQH